MSLDSLSAFRKILAHWKEFRERIQTAVPVYAYLEPVCMDDIGSLFTVDVETIDTIYRVNIFQNFLLERLNNLTDGNFTKIIVNRRGTTAQLIDSMEVDMGKLSLHCKDSYL